MPIQWIWSNGEVCSNLCVFVKPHSNEIEVCTKGGFPPWLVTVGSQHYFAKKLGPRNMLGNDDSCGMHGRQLHAQEGKNTTSFVTHHKGEYWKCNTNYKWPKERPKKKVA